MGALEVKKNLHWVGVLDPDLRVFDVIMYTDYGTTYNSYILKTSEGNILFETVKMKYFDKFIENINEVCPVDSIKYIVVDHTEPDHVGSLAKLLDYAPNAKVVGSQVALNFLAEICNRDIPGVAVGDGDKITLGEETVKFLSVPFLHWPDSIYSYIESSKSLITCDSFGCHYADPKVFNDKIDGEFVDAYKYYFDMIMGPFKSHIRYALEQMKQYDIETICPGHGPVLRENLGFYLDLYEKWSYEEELVKTEKPVVINSFVSAYGYTEEMAREINHGIKDIVDAEIKLFDMVYADQNEVLAEIKKSDGFLLGTPTVNGDALPPVSDLALKLNGVVDGGKVAAAYGSYGWSGEGPDFVNSRLNILRMDTIEPPFKVNFKPSEENREQARAFGRRFGKKVKEKWEQVGNTTSGKTYWKCTVCGEIFEGALPPMTCPVCGVGSEAFVEAELDVTDFVSEIPLKSVIIGSGVAAVSAAEAIRKRSSVAQIDIYTAESILPYYRPVLTEMISETISDESFFINPTSFYSDKNINIHLNSPVEKIDKLSKTVILSDKKEVSYDKLLIATGSSPFVPPFKGSDLNGVYTLRSDKDLAILKDAITAVKNPNILVVGGGLLGLEAASSLAKLNSSVTVVDTAPNILPRQTNQEASGVLQKLVEKSSIEIITDTVVQEIYGDKNGVTGVVLANGADIKTDIVLVSAGMAANISLAEGADLKTDRAIVVNSKMESSTNDIYSAGDCAISNSRYYGIWESALAQGRVAGANMVGEELTFEPRLYPATLNAFDTSLFAMGNLHNAGDDEQDLQKISSSNELKEEFSTLFFKDGKIDGAILIGDISKAAPIISAVSSKLSIDDCVDCKIIKG
jgi:flavorubredoxin/NADPH-dependent 2,4-dienoyl-CoA reductase/sulfur reductase-like enzyme